MNQSIKIILALFMVFLSSCSKRSPKPITSITTTTLDGDQWTFADHKEKVILVHFWATWCGPCKTDEPWLKEQYDKYAKRSDFLMIGVALDSEAEAVRQYCRDKGIQWQQLHEPGREWKNSVFKSFGLRGIPKTWLIHKDGTKEKLPHLRGQVDGVLGIINYDSLIYCHDTILKMMQEKGRVTEKTIIEICGQPDEKRPMPGTNGKITTWKYIRTNAAGRQLVVQIDINDNGFCQSLGRSSRSLKENSSEVNAPADAATQRR